MSSNVSVGMGFFVICLILFIVVGAPLLTIWSLNTLFALGIEITVWTWLAMAWLHSVTFGGGMVYKIKN